MSFIFWENKCTAQKEKWYQEQRSKHKQNQFDNLQELSPEEREKKQINGWMWKKGADIVGRYHLRWFQQDQNVLNYYKNQKNLDRPQGKIFINEIVSVGLAPNSATVIEIKTPSRTFVLGIDPKKISATHNTTFWIHGLTAWSNYYKKNDVAYVNTERPRRFTLFRSSSTISGKVSTAPEKGTEPQEKKNSQSIETIKSEVVSLDSGRTNYETVNEQVQKTHYDPVPAPSEETPSRQPQRESSVDSDDEPILYQNETPTENQKKDVYEEISYQNAPVDKSIYAYSREEPNHYSHTPNFTKSPSGLRISNAYKDQLMKKGIVTEKKKSTLRKNLFQSTSSINTRGGYDVSPTLPENSYTTSTSSSKDEAYSTSTPVILEENMYTTSDSSNKPYNKVTKTEGNINMYTSESNNSEAYDVQNIVVDDDESTLVYAHEDDILDNPFHLSENVIKSANGFRDWNSEFIRVREQHDSNFMKILMTDEIALLSNQFVDTATTYAKIIISEMAYKDVNLKTVKPASLGGIAGGEKFMHSNIIFKLGMDTQVAKGFWMYGGNRPNHDAAMKAIKAELIGLSNYLTNSFGLDIYFPFMATIDFKGFRMLCITVLPVAKSTILYGSNDAGKHVHAAEPELNESMVQIAERLNLAGHPVGSKGTEIYGPGDIEAHRGYDGRYYCLDFGRVFPPEDPSVRGFKDNRAVFYQYLRPELVRDYPVPLSSDALTQWGAGADRRKFDSDVNEATKYLHQVIIPKVAEEISKVGCVVNWEHIYGQTGTSEEAMTSVIENFDAAFFHRQGINLRHLGKVRSLCTCDKVSKVLLSICIARTVKDALKEAMRERMDVVMTPSDEPFKELVVSFLSNLLGHGKQSKFFWEDLKEALQLKYLTCLTEKELDPEFDLRDATDVRMVVYLVLLLCNIKISHSAIHCLLNDESFLIDVSDIESLEAQTRHSYITYLSESVKLTKDATRQTHPTTRKRIFEHASRQLKLATQVAPHCPMITLIWGASLSEAAYVEKDPKRKEFLWDWAFNKLETAIQTNPWFSAMQSTFSDYNRLRGETETDSEQRKKFLEAAQTWKIRATEAKSKLSDNNLLKGFELNLHEPTGNAYWFLDDSLHCKDK